jgi:glutamate transport system permease protein
VPTILANLDVYFEGFWVTLQLTLLGFALALVIGTIVVSLRISPAAPARAAGLTYVEVVRSIPLLVILLLFYFGLTKVGIRFSGVVTAIVAVGLYHAAFVAETLRSGINAVAVGQAEAARSLGLTFRQVLRYVVLPQAFRTVVPPLGNIFIALTKNTSLASVIAVLDLTGQTDRLQTELSDAIPIYLGAAVAYLVLVLPAGLAFGALERRVAIIR